MRLTELRGRLGEVEFPVDREELKAQLDGVEFDAPNGDPVDLAERSDRIDGRHIGRKYYDDRSRSVGGNDLSF
jgi:hypothetical protein